MVYVLTWGPNGSGWTIRALDGAARRTTLRKVAKGIGVYDPMPPEPGSLAAIVGAVADALCLYEVSGRADVARLARRVLLGVTICDA